jgi:hypothetical protein
MPHTQDMTTRHANVHLDQRSSDRWHVDWPLEGFLQLDDDPGQTIQVTLVDFSGAGLAVVLTAEVALHPGQTGQLITQSHGSGCRHRLVRCTWRRPHQVDPQLQSAGFSFQTGAKPHQP